MKFLKKNLVEKAAKNQGFLVLQSREVRFLDTIGVTQDEKSVYDLLLYGNKPFTAQNIASSIAIFPSACYRLFYSLENLGAIKQVGVRPKSYIAIKPKFAFPIMAELKREAISASVNTLKFNDTPASSSVEILIGRQALYERYCIEVSKSSHIISAHSIGIAYSDEMYNVMRLALKRGVVIRYAFQQYKSENFHILKKWKDMGVNLRHYKSERGFHLMLFDNEKVLLSFSNPNNTEDRISIFTTDKTAIAVFKSYFEGVWLNARHINLE